MAIVIFAAVFVSPPQIASGGRVLSCSYSSSDLAINRSDEDMIFSCCLRTQGRTNTEIVSLQIQSIPLIEAARAQAYTLRCC